MDVGLFARVEAAPEDRQAVKFTFGEAQPFQDSRAEIAFGMVERKFDFGEAQHAGSSRNFGRYFTSASRRYACVGIFDGPAVCCEGQSQCGISQVRRKRKFTLSAVIA
jgi:hypothetical protein